MNLNGQHIVFLTPGFAQNEQDTTTIPAVQIYIKALKREFPQLRISIIAFQFPYTNKIYNWLDCEIIPLNGRNKKSNKIIVWRKAYITLNKIHKENPVHIIHSFWLRECALVGSLFSFKKEIKHIATFMGQDVLTKNFYLNFLPLSKMKLVSLSEYQQQQLSKKFRFQTEIIPWGIDPNDFTTQEKKSIDIIGVGSLIPLKNYDFFIDVVFEINKTRPVKAVIVGDGIQKEFLIQKIKKLQLEETITLTGLLDYKETLSTIAKSKVLLHTSNYEGFGLVFAEALQSKTKIVSHQVGCAIPSKNWFVCNTKTELIQACLIGISAIFDENNAHQFVIKNTVENYLKLYNE